MRAARGNFICATERTKAYFSFDGNTCDVGVACVVYRRRRERGDRVIACTFEKAPLHANSINSGSTGLYILLLFRDTQTSCLELPNARAGAAASLVNRRLFRYEKFVCRFACPRNVTRFSNFFFLLPLPCSRYICQLCFYSILLVAEGE